MIHWAFLLAAFVLGFVSCYALIYQVAKVAGQVMGAIEAAAKGASL